MAPPSDQPTPSAAPAYALHRPSGASPRCRLNSMKTVGVALTVAPPANARSHSPVRSDCTAMGSAPNEDEHAVSTEPAGPSSPSTYDPRPDATLEVMPVSR